MNTTVFQKPERQLTSEHQTSFINSILRQPLCKPVIAIGKFISKLSVKPFNVDDFIIQRTDKPWSSYKDI